VYLNPPPPPQTVLHCDKAFDSGSSDEGKRGCSEGENKKRE